MSKVRNESDRRRTADASATLFLAFRRGVGRLRRQSWIDFRPANHHVGGVRQARDAAEGESAVNVPLHVTLGRVPSGHRTPPRPCRASWVQAIQPGLNPGQNIVIELGASFRKSWSRPQRRRSFGTTCPASHSASSSTVPNRLWTRHHPAGRDVHLDACDRRSCQLHAGAVGFHAKVFMNPNREVPARQSLQHGGICPVFTQCSRRAERQHEAPIPVLLLERWTIQPGAWTDGLEHTAVTAAMERKQTRTFLPGCAWRSHNVNSGFLQCAPANGSSRYDVPLARVGEGRRQNNKLQRRPIDMLKKLLVRHRALRIGAIIWERRRWRSVSPAPPSLPRRCEQRERDNDAQNYLIVRVARTPRTC